MSLSKIFKLPVGVISRSCWIRCINNSSTTFFKMPAQTWEIGYTNNLHDFRTLNIADSATWHYVQSWKVGPWYFSFFPSVPCCILFKIIGFSVPLICEEDIVSDWMSYGGYINVSGSSMVPLPCIGFGECTQWCRIIFFLSQKYRLTDLLYNSWYFCIQTVSLISIESKMTLCAGQVPSQSAIRYQ